MNTNKSWRTELAKELFIDLVWIAPLFVGGAILGGFRPSPSLTAHYLLLLLGAFILRLFMKLYARIILRKLPKSKFYRLPQISTKGTIVQKRIHTYSASQFVQEWFADYFLREWILFETVQGEHIKIYLSAAGINLCNDPNFIEPRIGAEGTLTYRKARNHNYFEDFMLSFNE